MNTEKQKTRPLLKITAELAEPAEKKSYLKLSILCVLCDLCGEN